jgi:hypothetical protein
MPAAAPIPRGPSALILDGAASLLTGPGCPVCRYASEAGDRYFGWFALEGCGQTDNISRLARSLGMCPRHTRRLMRQPGAAPRLTAVYRFVLQASRHQLATGRRVHLAGCPACEHDEAATVRALDTLLDALDENLCRERYQELGGLCLPHLRAAATRVPRCLAAWLARVADTAAVTPPPAGPGWLAGMDDDVAARTVLRLAGQAQSCPKTVCQACYEAARAEDRALTELAAGSAADQPAGPGPLCAGHLADAALLTGRGGLPDLLARQARWLAVGLPHHRLGVPGAGRPAGRLWPWRTSAGLEAGCAVCQRREAAVARALASTVPCRRQAQPDADRCAALCARHVLARRTADRRAALPAARHTVRNADLLIAELDHAFRKNTWAGRQEVQGPEMNAWRRAAAFLDGGVFCGGPPPGRREPLPMLEDRGLAVPVTWPPAGIHRS